MIAKAHSTDQIVKYFSASLDNGVVSEKPYRHWLLRTVFPDRIVASLNAVEFPLQELDGVSGKRELHNESRHYFDDDNIQRFPVIGQTAEAFQSPAMIEKIESFFSIDLAGSFLRIEYAQDIDGFWLEPHTDLGVKKLTVLIYMSDDPAHSDLGTDVYNADKSWALRMPFAANTAMAFVPSDNTYHVFERRYIDGVRRSLILNYVTDAWRDREQLAYPHAPIAHAR